LEVSLKQIVLASIVGLAVLLATAFPNWIELITGWNLDGRDGSIELLVPAGLLALTGLAFALTAMKRRLVAKKYL
jgi:hypothetical protein